VLDYTFSNLYTYITIYQHNGDASPENSAPQSTLCKSFPTRLIYIANLAALFCTWLKRLPHLLCMGPNTPLLTQVSVSLVPYKLNF
jgi:hypothetical protein